MQNPKWSNTWVGVNALTLSYTVTLYSNVGSTTLCSVMKFIPFQSVSFSHRWHSTDRQATSTWLWISWWHRVRQKWKHDMSVIQHWFHHTPRFPPPSPTSKVYEHCTFKKKYKWLPHRTQCSTTLFVMDIRQVPAMKIPANHFQSQFTLLHHISSR